MGLMVSVYLTFKKIAKIFSKVSYYKTLDFILELMGEPVTGFKLGNAVKLIVKSSDYT